MLPATLPMRKIWRPSSRALVNRYDVIEEPAVVASVYQRLRQPMLLGASVLIVTSAVYLGFIHSNDLRVGTPVAVSGKVQTQNARPSRPSIAVVPTPATTVTQPPSSVIAQRSAPVRSPPLTPPAAPPPAQRRVALAATDARRAPGSPPGSPPGNPPDKPRPDVSRYLRAARANLQENNLSATKTRLAAAIAAQPDNRDALRMRAALNTREQQRDALLSLARGCGYIARWACVSRNAGNALQIDTSSKEAQRLVTLALHESELQPQIAPPPAEPPPEPMPDARDVITHH